VGGDGSDALDVNRLAPEAYGELRRIAAALMRRERPGQTLQPTALVHEAYMRLVAAGQPWRDERHFVGIVARAMRQILVDYARRREARKRGRDFTWTELSDELPEATRALADVIALDGALDALERVDPELGMLVEFHVFAGLAMDDVAALRGISTRTAFREWRKARAFLLERIAVGSNAA
jgi:RNA polymerase sigma factor (TIGR02999 family)